MGGFLFSDNLLLRCCLMLGLMELVALDMDIFAFAFAGRDLNSVST